MGLWSEEGASGLLADVKLFDLIHRSIKKMSKYSHIKMFVTRYMTDLVLCFVS